MEYFKSDHLCRDDSGGMEILKMERYLAFVTIDVWTLVFTWVNLFILFLLMKKFLFKPVRELMQKREQEVKDLYAQAEQARTEAEQCREEYQARLEGARRDADEIVKNATRSAQLKSEALLRDAQQQTAALKERAAQQIEAERKNALHEVKKDVSSLAVSIAGKVIEQELDESAHQDMIDKFIDELGDVS